MKCSICGYESCSGVHYDLAGVCELVRLTTSKPMGTELRRLLEALPPLVNPNWHRWPREVIDEWVAAQSRVELRVRFKAARRGPFTCRRGRVDVVRQVRRVVLAGVSA